MGELYYDDELYELGWGFSKIFKRVKRVFKRVKKTVKRVAKKAIYVATGVVSGALGAAVYAADRYVSSYQSPSSSSSSGAPRPQPRYYVITTQRGSSTSKGISSPDWQKYLPWILGGGALLLLSRGK